MTQYMLYYSMITTIILAVLVFEVMPDFYHQQSCWIADPPQQELPEGLKALQRLEDRIASSWMQAPCWPTPPNVPPLRVVWSLLDGILGVLNSSWGVLGVAVLLFLFGHGWLSQVECRVQELAPSLLAPFPLTANTGAILRMGIGVYIGVIFIMSCAP